MFLSGLELSNDQRKSQDLPPSRKATCLMEHSVYQGQHSKFNWQPRSRWIPKSVEAPDMPEIVIERPTCGF